MNDLPNEKKPDLSEIFDLSRHKAVANFVQRFEELMRQKDSVQQDIKELAAEAKDQLFSPLEIKAMQDIAKLRKDDKSNAAAEKLAAIRRVSNAMGMDLFAWSDNHRA